MRSNGNSLAALGLKPKNKAACNTVRWPHHYVPRVFVSTIGTPDRSGSPDQPYLIMAGDGDENSNTETERAKHHRRSRASPACRRRAAGHTEAFGDSAGGTNDLGVTASCRPRTRNRPRLRRDRLARRRDDLTALRRDPGDVDCLSCARRDLVALAPKETQPMTSELYPHYPTWMPRVASSVRISSCVRSGTAPTRCNSQARSPFSRNCDRRPSA